MCCFMVLVNLPADLGLLCMFLQEEKKKKGLCTLFQNILEKQELS